MGATVRLFFFFRCQKIEGEIFFYLNNKNFLFYFMMREDDILTREREKERINESEIEEKMFNKRNCLLFFHLINCLSFISTNPPCSKLKSPCLLLWSRLFSISSCFSSWCFCFLSYLIIFQPPLLLLLLLPFYSPGFDLNKKCVHFDVEHAIIVRLRWNRKWKDFFFSFHFKKKGVKRRWKQ